MRVILLDVAGFLALAFFSFLVGLAINAFRAVPLPLVYQTPGERLAASVVTGDGRQETWNAAGIGPGGAWRVKREAWTVTEISLEELKALIGKPEVLILDARPFGFYKRGHIPSAQNLSKLDFQRDFQRLRPQLEASRLTGLRHAGVASATQAGHGSPLTIVVYCYEADCDDGEIVAQALARLGFGPTWVFKGGWEAWKAARLEIEKAE